MPHPTLTPLTSLAALIGAEIIGDSATIVCGVASLAHAQAGQLVFVEQPRALAQAIASPAAAIIAPLGTPATAKPLLLVKNPKLAFAQVVRHFYPVIVAPATIHPTAIIDPTAVIAPQVSIGAYSSIGADTTIGPGCQIGPNVVIGAHVTIGAECQLHAQVRIYDNVQLGQRVIVQSGTVIGGDGFGYVYDQGQYHKFPQVGTVIIEDEVELGCNVTIDRGALDETRIGQGTKIDNLVQVGHNVQIGKHCVLAAQVGVSGSSVLEDNVVVGGQVGIADHVYIEKGAIIGAQAGIPSGKRIRPGFVWGTPARPMQEFKEIYALTQQLPRWKQRLLALEKLLLPKSSAE